MKREWRPICKFVFVVLGKVNMIYSQLFQLHRVSKNDTDVAHYNFTAH